MKKIILVTVMGLAATLGAQAEVYPLEVACWRLNSTENLAEPYVWVQVEGNELILRKDTLYHPTQFRSRVERSETPDKLRYQEVYRNGQLVLDLSVDRITGMTALTTSLGTEHLGCKVLPAGATLLGEVRFNFMAPDWEQEEAGLLASEARLRAEAAKKCRPLNARQTSPTKMVKTNGSDIFYEMRVSTSFSCVP